MSARRAPAKINLALVVGPPREDGKHELVDGLPADRRSPTASTRRTAAELAVDGLRRRHARPRGARCARRAGRRRAALARDDREADPGRGRARRRQLRRGDRAPARERSARRAAGTDALHELARELGADVPFFLDAGPAARRGRRHRAQPLDLPQDYWVLLLLPHGVAKASTADVYRALRRTGRRSAASTSVVRRCSTRSTSRAAGRPRALPPNDLASSSLSAELVALGAFRADVSGAGPAVYALFEDGAHARGRAADSARRGETWVTAPAWYG